MSLQIYSKNIQIFSMDITLYIMVIFLSKNVKAQDDASLRIFRSSFLRDLLSCDYLENISENVVINSTSNHSEIVKGKSHNCENQSKKELGLPNITFLRSLDAPHVLWVTLGLRPQGWQELVDLRFFRKRAQSKKRPRP